MVGDSFTVGFPYFFVGTFIEAPFLTHEVCTA